MSMPSSLVWDSSPSKLPSDFTPWLSEISLILFSGWMVLVSAGGVLGVGVSVGYGWFSQSRAGLFGERNWLAVELGGGVQSCGVVLPCRACMYLFHFAWLMCHV